MGIFPPPSIYPLINTNKTHIHLVVNYVGGFYDSFLNLNKKRSHQEIFWFFILYLRLEDVFNFQLTSNMGVKKKKYHIQIKNYTILLQILEHNGAMGGLDLKKV